MPEGFSTSRFEDDFPALAPHGMDQGGSGDQALVAPAGLEPVEALLAAPGLRGALPGAKTPDVFLFLGDEGLLLFVTPFLGQMPLRPQLREARIVGGYCSTFPSTRSKISSTTESRKYRSCDTTISATSAISASVSSSQSSIGKSK